MAKKGDGRCCAWCPKRLPVGARGDMLYCSRRCRQLAYLNRRRVAQVSARSTLPKTSQDDIKVVRKYSVMCADVINSVARVAGRELAESVLDGVMDLLTVGLKIPVEFRGE